MNFEVAQGFGPFLLGVGIRLVDSSFREHFSSDYDKRLLVQNSPDSMVAATSEICRDHTHK